MTDVLQNRRLAAAAPLFLLLIVLLMIFVPSQAPAWEYSESSFDIEGRLAMMAKAGIWNPYLEVKGVFHGSELAFRYNSFTAGTYIKVAPWLKLGAFYRLQGGVRHLDDWTVVNNVSPTPDEQYWEEVSPWRYENVLIADATPRFLLIPGGNWLAAVKVRYAYNFYNDNQVLLLRPGLTWVMMRDRQPLVNFSLQYPLYFALNFGDVPLYGHGPYLVALWHVNDRVKLEGKLQYLAKTYAKTEQGGPWILHSHHLGIGLGLVFTPDFGR